MKTSVNYILMVWVVVGINLAFDATGTNAIAIAGLTAMTAVACFIGFVDELLAATASAPEDTDD